MARRLLQAMFVTMRQAPVCTAGAPLPKQDGYGYYYGAVCTFVFGASQLVLSAADSQNDQRASNMPATEGIAPTPPTNHPLDFDPVTNENTANMTLARKAALDSYAAGRYKEAERKFLEAIREAELGFGGSDPHVAACKNNLAEFYRNTQQFSKAEDLYQQAIQQLHDLYGEKHWLYVGAVHNLALLYDAKGDLEAAEATFRRVLKLRLAMFGPKHYLYADTMFALAHTLQKQGKRDAEVVKLMKHSVDVLEESGNVEATAILYWLMELCKVLQQTNDHALAATYLRKAVDYLAADEGEMQAQGSEFADMLVASLEKSKRVGEAREVQERCVQARLSMFGHHLLVARSMAKLAALEMSAAQEGSEVRARQWAAMALQICDEIWHTTSAFQLKDLFAASSRLARCQDQLQAAIEYSRLVRTFLQQRLLQAATKPVGGEGSAADIEVALLKQAAERLERSAQGAEGYINQSLPEQFQRLPDLFVDAKLTLVEVWEDLLSCMRSGGASSEEVQAIEVKCEALAQSLC